MSVRPDPAPGNLMRDWALAYAELGWHVFPVFAVDDRGRCECGCRDLSCTTRGKHPRPFTGFKAATTDAEQIRRWWASWPRSNIGIACGASGLVVVDIDPRHEGDASYAYLVQQLGQMAFPETVTSETGGGGQHYVYTALPGFVIGNSNGALGKGIDIRGVGGYFIAPPSVHISRNYYLWQSGYGPQERDPVPLSLMVAQRLAQAETQTERRAAPPVTGAIPQGQRDSTLASLAGSMRRRGMGREAIYAALSAENAARCDPPLADADIQRIAGSVARYAPAAPLALRVVQRDPLPDAAADPAGAPPAEEDDLQRSDLGNARRLIARYGERLRFVRGFKGARAGDRGGWLAWDGKRWAEDGTGAADRYAKRTVKAMYDELSAIEDDKERAQMFTFIVRSENSKNIRDMLLSASTEREFVGTVEQFDANPWLLNLLNGTLDLRTGTLRKHERADYLTRIAPVVYDPDATCPVFLAYLTRIMAGDCELISYLQRAIGYSLTGRTSEQVMFVLWGSGANGKGTLLRMLAALLGDYAQTAEPSTFTEKRTDRVSNDIAALRGARLVEMSEGASGERLAEPLIKRITGQDPQTCRFLFGEYFTFMPEFKLWYATNHKPVIHDAGDAMWRRMRLIPFEVVIPEAEFDTSLDDKLRAELPGILNWAVEGCRLWQESRLAAPAAVVEATQAYREEMDELAPFLAERCVAHPRALVAGPALYASYKRWAENNGDKPLSSVAFGRKVGQHPGVSGPAVRSGVRWWSGIGLKAETGATDAPQ